MNEQWQELKETIIELRDNDGTGTQQEVCKFLANLMGVLEKQMQEPKTEKVIKMRDATPEERESIDKYIKSISKPTGVNFWDLEQEPILDKIRAEIEFEVDHRTNMLCAEDVFEIIDKYKESEPQERSDKE